MKFNKKLKGERIILKAVEPKIEIAKKIYEIISSQRERFAPWFIWERHTNSIEDAMKFLFETQDDFKKKEKIIYGIYLEKEFIGLISIFKISVTDRSARIGYWLSLNYTREGYMSEAVGIVEKEFFENQKLNKLSIDCDLENNASKNVARKAGFKQEAHLREDSYSEYHMGFRDSLIFSKLKKEYKNK